MSHQGAGFEAEKWKEISRIYRRTMGLALGRKSGKAEVEEIRWRLASRALGMMRVLAPGK